ncbi:MAG: superoxide dismutase [Candidatus Omnitrophica bacterium]|nr:superoxide dismutase [Candidatus Omnitrophota bacterium]MCA9418781.1 superoxide dismutase [Candidatus Omnitrophota bacterium]MCA9424558.1 superoxide dismutase [Candidatus Omnitrophota bacterium]MCA9430472.1 superoxide dismutase [Candidatus Omnitrophota bacterium]MCA9435231.1 superoxide dismutase [Candidatus Omnitrophota bacterium]
MKKFVPVSLFAILALFVAQFAFSHCEIPCGIYDDEARFNQIAEDITTVEKSMNQINELSQAGDKNYNQIVRWVVNKDDHAQKIQDTVAQYFLAQRIKPVDGADADGKMTYYKKLELCHNMIVQAMKAKQTTDLEHVKQLNSLLENFREVYFEKK